MVSVPRCPNLSWEDQNICGDSSNWRWGPLEASPHIRVEPELVLGCHEDRSRGSPPECLQARRLRLVTWRLRALRVCVLVNESFYTQPWRPHPASSISQSCHNVRERGPPSVERMSEHLRPRVRTTAEPT